MSQPKRTRRTKNPRSLIPNDGPYLAYIPGWTEERYFSETPESLFLEFADGELIVPSPASMRHQNITAFLGALLRAYVDEEKLGLVLNGPAVVRLRPGLAYEPDIFFVAAHQASQLAEQYFSGAPSLVVEVLSESTRNYDLGAKAANYSRHGVPEYWAVDANRNRLLRHALSTESTISYDVTELESGRLASQVIPGFWIEVSWLWQEPLPGTLECLREILRL